MPTNAALYREAQARAQAAARAGTRAQRQEDEAQDDQEGRMMDVYVVSAEQDYARGVILGVCSSLETAQTKAADWYRAMAEERRERYEEVGWSVIPTLGNWVKPNWVMTNCDEAYWVALAGWADFDNLTIYRMPVDADLDIT